MAVFLVGAIVGAITASVVLFADLGWGWAVLTFFGLGTLAPLALLALAPPRGKHASDKADQDRESSRTGN